MISGGTSEKVAILLMVSISNLAFVLQSGCRGLTEAIDGIDLWSGLLSALVLTWGRKQGGAQQEHLNVRYS